MFGADVLSIKNQSVPGVSEPEMKRVGRCCVNEEVLKRRLIDEKLLLVSHPGGKVCPNLNRCERF